MLAGPPFSASAWLVGCGLSAQTPSAPHPVLGDAGAARGSMLPKRGMYAGSYGNGVVGFNINNEQNKPPICTPGASGTGNGVYDIAVDPKGDLMVPYYNGSHRRLLAVGQPVGRQLHVSDRDPADRRSSVGSGNGSQRRLLGHGQPVLIERQGPLVLQTVVATACWRRTG